MRSTVVDALTSHGAYWSDASFGAFLLAGMCLQPRNSKLRLFIAVLQQRSSLPSLTFCELVWDSLGGARALWATTYRYERKSRIEQPGDTRSRMDHAITTAPNYFDHRYEANETQQWLIIYLPSNSCPKHIPSPCRSIQAIDCCALETLATLSPSDPSLNF